MRAWLITVFLVLVTLQSSWAAVSSHRAQDVDPAAHWVSGEFQQRAGAEDLSLPGAANSPLHGYVHCDICQGNCTLGLPAHTVLSDPDRAPLPSPSAAPAPDNPPLETPDRPKWSAVA